MKNHTHNFDADDFLNDVTADEATSTYKQISSPQFTLSTGDNDVFYSSNTDTLTWSSVAGPATIRGIIVFKSQSTSTLSELICSCSFSTAKAVNSDDVTVNVNANGFFRASYQT